MSGIFAAQLSAVATLALAVLAMATAGLAFAAWRKQSREVSDQAKMLNVQSEQLEELRKANAKQAEVLELQATELRKSLEERVRAARRRVRAQAQLVFLTEVRYEGRDAGPLDSRPPSITATVVNSSNQPIYKVEVYWLPTKALHGEPNADHLGIIMPGESASSIRRLAPDADVHACHAEVVFCDADTITFVRRADGYLTDLAAPIGSESLNAAYRKEGV
jgi:hypothetical protein